MMAQMAANRVFHEIFGGRRIDRRDPAQMWRDWAFALFSFPVLLLQ